MNPYNINSNDEFPTLKKLRKGLLSTALLSCTCFLASATGTESSEREINAEGRPLSERELALKPKPKREEDEIIRNNKEAITEAEHWDYAGMQITLLQAGIITDEEAERRCNASKARVQMNKAQMTEEEYAAFFAGIDQQLNEGKIDDATAKKQRLALRAKVSIFKLFTESDPKFGKYCEYEKATQEALTLGKFDEKQAENALAQVREMIWPNGNEEYKKYKLEW